MSDNISPSHYGLFDGKHETIDLIKDRLGAEAFKGYCEGNVIKYLMRRHRKNGVEDLRKAQKYLEWLIKTEVGV